MLASMHCCRRGRLRDLPLLSYRLIGRVLAESWVHGARWVGWECHKPFRGWVVEALRRVAGRG